ncbi:unnamed protein product [Brassica oleracea var. botrytis]|uniref:PABC domain-containing protein n=2 Tax=Brassica TaxID=3705 RepID=A0A3P6BBY9_BRAOL|nr:unnamed protein product [Brassica napus]CDY22977.1 BnaC03g40920D [Brassica napus]VDC93981.1 unnamed protein product [Brassica oleracea]
MPPPHVSVYSMDDFLACAAFYLIGETLYPLVELLEPLFAPKIRGMLLELPGTQIFRCIESPGYLRQKVNEASDVLVDWYPQQMKLDEQEAKKFRAVMIFSKL